eukprot:GEMP01004748.1.p1 GENE.GEMP01004748.1~~GEMP01004748.1.p1  ORF type:complete len:1084 (+),score=199.12 GEMP01004748.1:212-3463(+)
MGSGASRFLKRKQVVNEDAKRDRVRGLCEAASGWFIKKNQQTLECALAFVPWITQQAYQDGMLGIDSIVVHKGKGAVVFSDASGFTALTERLAQKPNGAELLSECLIAFFTPLIDIINAYRGDVIKFSGDALTIYFPAVNDTQHPRMHADVPPCGTYACEGHSPMELAVLRASACCVEIHKRLHMFETGVDGVKLCLHIGVGCGDVVILQVGGVCPPETKVRRYEYVITGPPLEQISIAEPLASNGETVLSPQAWEYVKHTAIEGEPLIDRPDFHRCVRMDETKHTFPTIKNSAMEADSRVDYQFNLQQLDVLRRYIPSAVFKQIEGGTLTYVNEMRNISVIFVSVCGIDCASEEGTKQAQRLMTGMQTCCYAHEGTVNKFLVDDKGMLFLFCFGLPPLVHMDDPTRAVLFCFDAVNFLRSMNLIGRFGITTGRNYCGIVGSASRMEYTMLGDTVNLSARLMAGAKELCILTDESTMLRTQDSVDYITFPPIKVKGKTALIPIFEPRPKEMKKLVGYEPSMPYSISFPFPPSSMFLGGKCYLTELESWWELHFVQRLLKMNDKSLTRKKASLGYFERKSSLPDVVHPFGVESMDVIDLEVNDTLFDTGGTLVLCGPSGSGKAELSEYVAVHAVTDHNMLPLFGTMGDRPNEKLRPVSELLKSSLAALRSLDPSISMNDTEALQGLLPRDLHPVLDWLGPSLGYGDTETQKEMQRQELDEPELWKKRKNEARRAVNFLVEKLIKLKRLIVIMPLIRGTNLYGMETSFFWELAEDFSHLANRTRENSSECLVLVVIARSVDNDNAGAMKMRNDAESHGWYCEAVPLEQTCVREYAALHLKVEKHEIPPPLLEFVTNLSCGNATYITETLEQLIDNGNVEVRRKEGSNEVVYTSELEAINIAKWHQTAMVGGAICLLESLDPLQAAVVKMATVFTGPFTISDLAASSCSRWAGATRFDTLRLFKSMNTLVQRNIIDLHTSRNWEVGEKLPDNDISARQDQKGKQFFALNNFLIRKVGGSMVLEQQKKAIKRQALIERVLQKDLPARMQELARKKAVPHIPWYYQIELPSKKSAYEHSNSRFVGSRT